MNLEIAIIGAAVGVLIYAAMRVRTLSYFQKKPPAQS